MTVSLAISNWNFSRKLKLERKKKPGARQRRNLSPGKEISHIRPPSGKQLTGQLWAKITMMGLISDEPLLASAKTQHHVRTQTMDMVVGDHWISLSLTPTWPS